MLRGGWREGALFSCPGFTSVSVPEPSTRLMSGSGGKGPHPYFNPLCTPQSTVKHHAKGWMGGRGGFGLMPRVLPQFQFQSQVPGS